MIIIIIIIEECSDASHFFFFQADIQSLIVTRQKKWFIDWIIQHLRSY